MDIFPLTLTGRYIRLEPLSESHVPGLAAAGYSESIWRYMLYGDLTNEEAMRNWVKDILGRQARGTDLAFTIISLKTGKAIGCTRYLEIRRENRGLEIGGTWLAVEHQGSAANPESKYLLLEHAFERLGCIRVQLKTDARNLQSQRAIEHLGAVREGLFRNHLILPDGTIRDSIYYSIIDSEWPGVKERLIERLKHFT